MWMWIRPPKCSRRLAQKLVFHLFFFYLRRTARVVFLHVLQFIRSQTWQMADEQHQMPRIVIVRPSYAPSGHSREAHAVLDDVVNLTIRKILRLRQAHVRNARIKLLPHLRRAAAVVAMATGAMVREMPPGFHQQLRRRLHGIAQLASAAGDRQPLQGNRQSSFRRARHVASAQSRRAQPENSHDHHNQRHSQQQK